MISASSVLLVQYNSAVKDVNFTSNYDNLILDQQKLHFKGGLKFTMTPFSSAVRDVAINNNSLLMIADNIQIDRVFKEPLKHIKLEDLLTQSSLFIEELDNTNNNYKKNYLDDNLLNFSTKINTPVFKFIFTEDYVYIINSDNKALTDRDSFFCTLEFNKDVTQRFNYILSETNIILFKYNTSYKYVIVFNGHTPYTHDLTIDSNVPNNSVLYIEKFKDINLNFNSIHNSYVSVYENNPLSAKNSIESTLDSKTKKYNQQYLFNLPYENPENKIYINSLKNYQNSNYNYRSNANYVRDYTGIFTGNNQHKGYDKIYLNYITSTTEKEFVCDEDITFICPPTVSADGILLQRSNLIEDGAIAGKNPYTSDRICLHNIDYKEINSNYTPSIIDGTWICSWLSAGDTSSIWVDRYYLDKELDKNLYERYYSSTNDTDIIDIPSQLKLIPNVTYRYFHQGQKNIKKYIEKFKSIDSANSTLLLNITSWDKELLIDQSIYNNNGILSYNTKNLNKNYLDLDGLNYVIFPASLSLEEDKNLTIGFWLHQDSWKEIPGYQIFGNFSEGGLGLFNSQIIPTSLFTLYDDVNNYIYNYNKNISLISERKANTNLTSINSPVWIMRNIDQSYWLIDSRYLTASKFDINNNVIYSIELNTISSISQVESDSEQNIYIVDNIAYKIIKINDYTGKLEFNSTYGIQLPKEFNRIEILQNYNGSCILKQNTTCIVGVIGDYSVADGKNNIWSVIGSNLYKNNIYYAFVGNIIQIVCDREDNLWFTLEGDRLIKLNTSTNIFEFDKIITSPKIINNTSKQQRYISFVTLDNNNKEEDATIIIDNTEKTCYYLNKDGNIINKINLLNIPSVFASKNSFININYTAFGDFTNYNFQRKYFNQKNNFEWKVFVKENINNNYTEEKIISLPFSVERFDPGWHYFAFVFDSSQGSIKAYVDGVVLHTHNFTPYMTSIKYTSKPYCIAAVTTPQGILNDIIGINDTCKYKGLFASLHIYKYSFDYYDINSLFKGTFLDMYKNLLWNINIGERNYIEQIDRFFMNKMPGSKSKLFNIKINNFSANLEQKKIIEQAIYAAIQRIIPADNVLNEIKWV